MVDSLLNSTEFYSLAGFTASDVNSSYVDFLITQINASVSQRLGKLFKFNPGFIDKYRVENSQRVFIIGSWQQAGVLDSVTVTVGGTGYTQDTVSVVVSGGSPATNATATATVTGGAVTSIEITFQGEGFTTAPTITILDSGSGVNATATSTISTLVAKLGEEDLSSLETLVEGTDYRTRFLKSKEPGRIYPISAIELLWDRASHREFVQVEGTYGYSGIVPPEIMLEVQLYAVLKDAVLKADVDTSTGGRGSVTKSKIDKVEISFGGESESNTNSVKEMTRRISAIIENTAREYEPNRSSYVTIVG